MGYSKNALIAAVHKKSIASALLKAIYKKVLDSTTISDVSATLKVVEVTATRQRERRLKSNQFD
jgi:hypothetical protein